MADKYVFYNNYSTTLAGDLLTAGTSCTVASAGSLATPASGYVLLLTFIDPDDNTSVEVVKVTAVSGVTLTITRAQEGTTAQDWATGTIVQARVTAAMLGTFLSVDFDLNTGNNALGTLAMDMQTYRASAGRAATGAYALALGYDNSATGQWSYAIGGVNTVTGIRGMAIGYDNTVNSNNALAWGRSIVVTGTEAIAIGDDVTVNAEKAIAIGASSYVYDPQDRTVWGAAAAVDVGDIRKIAASDAYVLYCTQAGTTGGTEPVVAAAGPITDNTARWLAITTDTQSAYSLALGYLAVAIGSTALAVGRSSEAVGTNTVAVGSVASARGTQSIAVGYGAATYADRSICIGGSMGAAKTRDLSNTIEIASKKYLPFEYARSIGGLDFIGEHDWYFTGAADVSETAVQSGAKVTFYSIPIQIGSGARPGTAASVKHGDSFVAGGYVYTAYCWDSAAGFFTTGTTAGSAPALTTTPGASTTDGTVEWICVAATAGFSLEMLLPDYARFTPTSVGVIAKWSAPGGGVTYPQLTFGPTGALTQWLGATTHNKLTGDYSSHFTAPTDTRGAKQFGAAVSTFGTDIDCVATIVWEGYIRESDVA